MLLDVSVNKPSSGSLLLCFAKVTIIKMVKMRRYDISSVVWIHIYPVLIGVCVCVCSAQCRMRQSHFEPRTARTHTHARARTHAHQ
jgi:hypothetical protein